MGMYKYTLSHKEIQQKKQTQRFIYYISQKKDFNGIFAIASQQSIPYNKRKSIVLCSAEEGLWMAKGKGILLYILILLLAYYAAPFLIQDTGSGIVILLGVIPAACVLCGFLLGYHDAFFPAFAVLSAFLFLPSVFLFFNQTALIYCPIYGILTLAANALGAVVSYWNKRRKKNASKKGVSQ